MVQEGNVHLHKYPSCRDQLGIHSAWQLFQMQKKMPPVGGLPFSKGYYYALPVLVMGVIMLVMSLYKAIAFLVTGDESICVPVEKEGGGLLD